MKASAASGDFLGSPAATVCLGAVILHNALMEKMAPTENQAEPALQRSGVAVTVDRTEQVISDELQAIAHGDLRNQAQVEAFYKLLSLASPHQRAESERLGLGLLVERRELQRTPSLVIQIAPDLSFLRYGELREELSVVDLNPRDRSGRLFAKDLDVHWLLTVPNPTLISPSMSALLNNGPIEAGDRVMQMIIRNERLTYFGDMPATWRGDLDVRVWSTNIDTVNFVKWLREAGVFEKSITRSAEIGVGIGGISQALLADNPAIEQHIITDISPFAINATRRNLRPYVQDDNLTWYLGKGVRTLGEQGYYDLIVTNPPYIPHPKGHDAVDPYRGTGLIRELFEVGTTLLNPDNPEAAIYIQISNLSKKDIERYQNEFPDVVVTPCGGPVEVPLKIWGVSREAEWIEYLKGQGLIERPDLAATTGLRYYHEISAIKLQRRREPTKN